MCAAAAIGPAIGAIGSAMSAAQSNKQAKRNYEQKLKMRERKWMQTRATYASKKVQFEQEVDAANIAAQRAYARTQHSLNNARALAMLQNQEDFKANLIREGEIEAKAAERGVRGKSIARALIQNASNIGTKQAMRTRGLTASYYEGQQNMEDVNRRLKGTINRSFGKVALQPIQDMAPPKPVMQNVGLTLMLGMGQALGAGIEGAQSSGTTVNNYYSTPQPT